MTPLLAVMLAIVSTDATAHEQRLLLSIAWHESGMRWDVGQCDVTGDRGRALGFWQTHTRDRSVCEDFRYAARVALRRVRASLAACSHLPMAERLAVYTSGSCDRGREASRRRWVD